MTKHKTTVASEFVDTLTELAKPRFPEGYRPSIHDRLDAADAAADIADSMGIDEDEADLAVHQLTQKIRQARAAR